jgi:hypothetical protein
MVSNSEEAATNKTAAYIRSLVDSTPTNFVGPMVLTIIVVTKQRYTAVSSSMIASVPQCA